uniref:Uncharacterized protein n=1 Tax=Manihot esculenta TaxID=3983 RepID=A0A2C9VLD8_MANES
MCLNSGNSSYAVQTRFEFQFQLPVSILHEVGYSAYNRFTLEVQMDKEITTRIPIVLKHNISEDG